MCLGCFVLIFCPSLCFPPEMVNLEMMFSNAPDTVGTISDDFPMLHQGDIVSQLMVEVVMVVVIDCQFDLITIYSFF